MDSLNKRKGFPEYQVKLGRSRSLVASPQKGLTANETSLE